MSESELEYGLGTASFTITPLGDLTIVLVVRYKRVDSRLYFYIYDLHSKVQSYKLLMWWFQVTTMFHLDRPMYLLGYLASQSRVYLIDKEFKWGSLGAALLQSDCFCSCNWSKFIYVILCSVMGYTLLLNLIEYKTLVMRGDFQRASEILPLIPQEHYNRYWNS